MPSRDHKMAAAHSGCTQVGRAGLDTVCAARSLPRSPASSQFPMRLGLGTEAKTQARASCGRHGGCWECWVEAQWQLAVAVAVV